MNSTEEILAFVDDSDGLYRARCNGFYEFLFNLRADTMKQFAEGLAELLFTEEYRKSHHWPSVV